MDKVDRIIEENYLTNDENAAHVVKTFSSYILTTKTNSLIKKQDGILTCDRCGSECTAFNSVLYNGNLPNSSEDVIKWSERVLLETSNFKPICFDCAGIERQYKKSSCCLYWIHSGDNDDITNTGYVGITNDIKNRVNSHFSSLAYYKCTNKRLFEILSGDCFIDILKWGTRDECLTQEYKYRPTERIGANRGAGGFCTRKDHGMAHVHEYKELKRFIKKCNSAGIKVDLQMTTLEDIRRAVDFISSLKGEGGLCAIDDKYPISMSNICRKTKSEKANARSQYCLNGEHYSLATLSEIYGVKPNTICYRLRRGWSLEEALGLVSKKPTKTITINEQIIPYSGKLTQLQADIAVAEFENGKNLNSIATDLGITPKILYCLFEKAQLC